MRILLIQDESLPDNLKAIKVIRLLEDEADEDGMVRFASIQKGKHCSKCGQSISKNYVFQEIEV